jgi:hypothetical protein
MKFLIIEEFDIDIIDIESNRLIYVLRSIYYVVYMEMNSWIRTTNNQE